MPATPIMVLCGAASAAAFLATPTPMYSPVSSSSRSSVSNVQMINLFGNNEESKVRREMLSARSAQAGDRKVTFRKQNAATTGLTLGMVFRETFSKAVIIDKIVPGTQADALKKQGKLREGDEITMVSATFGTEMWSARGIGKMRLEKSLAVRQGGTVDLVVTNPSEGSKKLAKEAEAERKKMNRLQAELEAEVNQELQKKNPFKFW